jgi:hypothetical protein
MIRTIVSFELLGQDTIFKLEDAPGDIPGLGRHEFADVSPLTAAGLVARGEALLKRLTAHPSVQAGLGAALTVPPGGEPAPLYFHMLAASADALPWEQIYDSMHGFCALDERWPIGRIARRRRTVTVRTFEPPLRIVAVLSAAGRSGLPQLETLLKAVASADATAIGTHLHVISGDEAVVEAAVGHQNVTGELIAGSASGLAQQLKEATPDIVHLLCHGGAAAGLRRLAFATLADADAVEGGANAEKAVGSLRLSVPDLVSALGSSDPWLLVLSACDSAEAADGPALAHDLAASGIPAVIGMRRLVDLTDTNLFCAALYPQVLRTINTAVAANGPAALRIIDWATSLTAPRKSMGGPDPSAADAWTDPVLYVQEEPFKVAFTPVLPVQDPAEYARLQGQLDIWRGYLARLDPETAAPAVLNEVLGIIAGLEAKLTPGGYG